MPKKRGVFTGHDPAREVGFGICQKLAGRVGSGQEVFEISPVGSGRVRRLSQSSRVGSGDLDPTRPARNNLTREKAWELTGGGGVPRCT